jgi:hypothetical protein
LNRLKAFGGIYDGLPPNTTKPLRLSKSQFIRQRMEQDRRWVPPPIRALPGTDRVEAVRTRQVDQQYQQSAR